ncbi:hypothetical protein HanHA300_Chr10g0377561 [Helianthus annuus]|nr:hypothetical protein HanHA300_Chr10g0377561 [Helianthus annuus]
MTSRPPTVAAAFDGDDAAEATRGGSSSGALFRRVSLSLYALSLSQMGLVVMGLVVVGFDDGGGGGGGGGGAVVVAGEKFLWCEVFGLGFVKMFEAKVLSFFLR